MRGGRSRTNFAARNKTTRMANNFKYQQQYGVIVICKDEAEQKAVYERLAAQGLTLKVVCV